MKRLILITFLLLSVFPLSADMSIIDYAVMDSMINKDKHQHQGECKLFDNYVTSTELMDGKTLMADGGFLAYKDMEGKHFQNLDYNTKYLVNCRRVVFEWEICKCQYTDDRIEIVRIATKEDLDLYENNKKWWQYYDSKSKTYKMQIWIIIVLIMLGIGGIMLFVYYTTER